MFSEMEERSNRVRHSFRHSISTADIELIFEAYSRQHGKSNDRNYGIRIRKGVRSIPKVANTKYGRYYFMKGWRCKSNYGSLFTTEDTGFQEKELRLFLFPF